MSKIIFKKEKLNVDFKSLCVYTSGMKVLFPGSFDPPTNGHLNLIKRAATVFDSLEVVIADNGEKKTLFTVKEREDFLNEITQDIGNVNVAVTDMLMVDYAKKVGSRVMIRGVRALTDFGYEFELAMTNKTLNPDIEILFMPTDPEFFVTRSSSVKEIARMHGSVSGMVPECVEAGLKRKLKYPD